LEKSYQGEYKKSYGKKLKEYNINPPAILIKKLQGDFSY